MIKVAVTASPVSATAGMGRHTEAIAKNSASSLGTFLSMVI